MSSTAAMTAVLALLLFSASAGADEGEAVYQQCVTCHQPGGVGIPGIFPPLRNRLAEIAATAAGREYAATVLIDGLVGTIEIDGQRYIGAMPAQGLSNAKIAAVFNYIMTEFADPAAAGSTKRFSAEEVAGIRARHGGQNAPSALSLRSKVPHL